MSVQLAANILIGIALVAFLAYRQATWQYLDPARIWRGPLIMGVIGVVVLAQTKATITSMDVVFLGIEALITVGVGLTMGRITRFRTVGTPDDKGRTIQSRTGWLGAGLWIVLIVVRIGLDVVGVVVLAQTKATVTTTDVVFLAVEALITVGVGLTMGRITRFRTVGTPDSKGRTMQSRTGGLGAGLWIVLIVVRVGLDVLGGHLGAHLLTSTGTILLVLALNRAARALVIDQRIPRDDSRSRGMMVR